MVTLSTLSSWFSWLVFETIVLGGWIPASDSGESSRIYETKVSKLSPINNERREKPKVISHPFLCPSLILMQHLRSECSPVLVERNIQVLRDFSMQS